MRELNPQLELFVITNGTHWNRKIEKLVNELNFDIAVSIDAFEKEKLERIRKNVVYEKLMENIHRFSEICTHKKKHLSLSFTVQKDNWEQLPLIIKLCNEVNAFIYVSYLERPVRFAITDLSKDELIKIRTYMEKFSLPAGTLKEKHNAKCFEDFKHYLDVYIGNNMEKKYRDYEFDRNLLSTVEFVGQHEVREILPVPYSILSDWINKHYDAKSSFSEMMPKDRLFEQLNSVLYDCKEEDRELLHALILNGNFEPFLMSFVNRKEDELTNMAYESLKRYRELVSSGE